VIPVALVGGGGLAAGGFLLLLQRLLLNRSVSGAGRTLHEVLLFSPSPEDLITRVNVASGRTVYPGVVALALAVLAVVALSRQRPASMRRMLWIFAPLLVSASSCLSAPGAGSPCSKSRSGSFHRGTSSASRRGRVLVASPRRAGGWARTLTRQRSRLAGAVALGSGSWSRRTTTVATHRVSDLRRRPRVRGDRAGAARSDPVLARRQSYSGLYLYATTLTRVHMLNASGLARPLVSHDVYRPSRP
jgi:hypothetical protein